MIIPGSGGLDSLPAQAVLDSEADVSSIPEPLLGWLEARLSGVQLRTLLEQVVRTMRVANDHVVSVTHKTVALQVDIDTPWGAVVLYPERCAVMPGSRTVSIGGRVILITLGLNLSSQMFQLAQARLAGPVFGVEKTGYTSFRWVALSFSALQNRRGVKSEQNAAVE